MIELCTAFLAISSSYGLLGMKMVEVSQSAVLEETAEWHEARSTITSKSLQRFIQIIQSRH